MHTDLHPFANPGRTKLALVSRGVALPDGLPHASRFVAQANAVESVIDLRLPGGQFVTAPVGLPFTEQSGFALRVEDGAAWLECGGERQRVSLIEAPAFYRRKTRGGARMGSFAALHDRLLMLHPWLGCGFFAREGQACRYCQYDSMLNAAQPPLRDPLELVEVVRAALAEREVDMVYLYNGYSPGEDGGLSRLIPVIALLRKHLGARQIALETVAPRDVTVIDELYAAGLDVFVCNLEVADAARFAELCPGKQAAGGQEAVWRALARARQVFRAGSVVSHLIVGLEPLDSTVAGMKALIGKGVVPLLVPFRPLPGTPLAGHPLPSLDDVEQALLVQYELLAESGLPTHRLRDMGRVLTPMESRALVGARTTLGERMAGHALGRRLHGWADAFRRALRLRAEAGAQDDGRAGALDDRPIWRLFGERAAPFAALALLAALFAMAVQAAPPEGLDARGWHALAVFALCLVLWVTQLLPLPVTSILGLSLLPVLGVMPVGEAYAMFGNPAVFFILGAFVLAAGVMRTGLAEHLALWVLARAGASGLRLLLAVFLLPALLACFMPEHAVVAALLPLLLAVASGLGLRRGDRYAAALFLALAWGAVIGGVTTMLGGARGPLALAIVGQSTGASFGFMDWTQAALPIVLPLLAFAGFWLTRISGWREVDMRGAAERIAARRLELGRMGWRAVAMAALMLATVGAWLLAGEALDLAAISLLAVVAMFALRIARWREVQGSVDWGVILMYGGAIAVAQALDASGAASWLAAAFWPDGLSPWGALALMALVTMLLTESVSNTAAVAIMLPLALPMAEGAGLPPALVAIGVGIVSGFAFMLPMGTPANAMALGAGFLRPAQMARHGLALMLAALALFGAVSRWLWLA